MSFLTPNAEGELAVSKTFILQQLAQMRTTVYGLSDVEAHSAPTASDLNLSGLLLHAGEVARHWVRACVAATDSSQPLDEWSQKPIEALIDDKRPLSEVLDYFDRCVALASEGFDQLINLDLLVAVPDSPWIPEDIKSWEIRWCLNHAATEIARHVGHADIIRESIDGKVSFELNELADSDG